MATPTLPTFAAACLQVLKPSSSAKSPRASAGLVETVVCALAAIVPLFPTTLRPFNGQIRAAVRAYVAPTLSDPEPVPQSLRECSRRLMLALHHTAPKNTHADEWASLLAGWLKDSHATADQVFRAVQESWEPPSGLTARDVSTDDEPRGGGKQPNELPPWTGLDSGAQRLRGLLEAMSDCVGTASRSFVALPVAGLTDLVSRILLVLPPPPDAADRDLAMQLNPSVGREERDELWSVLPQLHIAALQLARSLAQRLGRNILPLASDILDQAVRALASYPQLADMRQTVFALVRDLLPICGPTLPRISVDSLAPTLQLCCHDLLVASGFAQDETQDKQAKANGTKAAGAQANADLFLPNKNTTTSSSSAAVAPTAAGRWQQKPSAPSAAHLAAAEALLEAALSHLPQQHLKKAERALLDRTAILCRSRAAMLAGVLNPYVDKSGRAFANTFPFLARQYPGDAAVELLRTNLRTKPHHFGSVFVDGRRRGDGEEDGDDEEEDGEDEAGDGERGAGSITARSTLTGDFRSQELGSGAATEAATTTSAAAGGFSRYFASCKMEVDGDEAPEPGKGTTQPAEEEAPFVPLVLKRKSVDHDGDDEEPMGAPAKRQDKGNAASVAAPLPPQAGGDSSDSDDESVQLEMVLDDDEEDEDEDEDEED